MTSSKYTDTVESFARSPVTLVRITVTGTITGEQIFRFSDKESDLIHLQIGQDVRPYLLSFKGRPTKIRPDQAVTEQARVSLTFVDDPSPPDFDSSVFTVNSGGTFWKRFFLAQPDFIGSEVEILRGFVEVGFTESDFELIFRGRLEDFQFQNDGTVTLVSKDALVLVNKEAPSQITDDNQIVGSVPADQATFTVDDASQITPPSSFGSRDLMPLVVRIDPDGADEEDIIISDISGNLVTVAGNALERSEEFDNAAWVKDSGVTVSANTDISPFGGVFNADRIEFPVDDDMIEQDRPSSISVNNETWVFSIWLKGDSSGTITIEFGVPGGAPNVFTNTVSLTTDWKRFEISGTFNGAAGNDPRIRIKRLSGDLDHCIAFGAQFEERSTRSFYVATTTPAAADGAAAGRGAFGTTAKIQSDNASFLEVVVYRHQLDESGINPSIVIRDLFSRSGFTDADMDLTIFNTEFDSNSSAAFRRGRATGLADGTIADPQGINSLAKEVREQSGVDIWISETGLLRAKSPLTIRPGDTIKIVTDEANIVDNSFNVKGNTDSRSTRVLVYFNIKVDTEGKDPEDFLNVRINVDLGIEALSGPKSRVIFSKWIFRSDEASDLASTIVTRYRRGLKMGSTSLELKDDLNIEVGSLLIVNSDGILITTDAGDVERGNTFWQVTQKQDNRDKGQIKLEMVLISDKRICLIAPASPPFPDDFDDASTEDRIYGFIGTAAPDNKLGDNAVDGCVIA